MKHLYVTLFFVTLQFPGIAKHTLVTSTPTEPVYLPSEDEISRRIQQQSGVFKLQFNQEVYLQISGYLVRGQRTTSNILGRAAIYLPIIEEYLAAYGLPDELKYLAVIESSMSPHATSSVGAAGLWQLMPATARRYGLVVNDLVDERRDPQKSTEAALKYLTFLYELLGDWTLAAAAYNCGGGGVQKALKAGNGTDFWAIRDHFPQQTQQYINRLAAVVYTMNYYQNHQIQPTSQEYFMQFTRVATIYKKLTFQQISAAIDIPVVILQRLNPSYQKGVIPDSAKGNYLILPKLKMDSFERYYQSRFKE